MSNTVLESAKQGSVEALNELVGLVQGYVAYVLRVKLGPGAGLDVEDLTQDVLLKLVENLPKFRGDNYDAFLGWASRICANTICKAIEKKRALKRGGAVQTVSINRPWLNNASEQTHSRGGWVEDRKEVEASLLIETDGEVAERADFVKGKLRDTRKYLAGHKGSRVRDVVGMMLDGATVEEVAERLAVSVGVVQSAVKRFRRDAKRAGLSLAR